MTVLFGTQSMASKEEIDGSIFFDSDLQEIDHYLQEFDKIHQSTAEANATNKMRIAMDGLEDNFRYILVAYTTSSNSSNPTDTDCRTSFTDSSFSSTPSPFRFSFSTNISVNESDVYDVPTEELTLSENHMLLSTEESKEGVQKLDFPSIVNVHEGSIVPIQSKAIYYLRCIADRMIASGCPQQRVQQAYRSIRRPVMDSNFLNLGIETLSAQQVKMLEWGSLEKKIKRWIQAAKVCFGMLFANEKMLLDQIFQGLSTADVQEACFLEIVKGMASQLFAFAEVVSTASSRSPDRLFRILDLYEALSGLLPDIETAFEGRYSESIRVQAVETLSKLAKTGRGILERFVRSVFHEISKKPMPGGEIDPLNKYVMDYLVSMAFYKQSLIELIVSKPSPLKLGNIYGADLNMNFVELEGKSPLALHLNLIFGILLSKLDDKSKRYENAPLAHFFMMNNVHFIVEKIERSPELRAMIEGDDVSFRNLIGIFRLAATHYVRSTWARLLNCFREEGLRVSGSYSTGLSRGPLKERFKTFNALFEEVHRTQATWLVPDIQLREELRISILEKLIPAYRSFLGRFGPLIDSARHPENYIKYSVEDLQDAVLSDFFEGCPLSSSERRSRLSWRGLV
ncbi:hypothetical protein ACH5RR_024314 [Cinchona calisaya]|uniref:Exocyst subunit Exo70 family protein n=1 Tax=Cinchona calisaya TaxID=153742 RepID=A0ABD2YZH5_9GENT